MRRTLDFGAFRRFGTTDLPRRDLAGLPPALERRLIALPWLDKAHHSVWAALCITANLAE
jgi:hypothetical protein